MTHLCLWPLSYVFVACRHFHNDTSLKVTKKTPNLEDPYLEFCNFVWPHLCIVGKIFLLAKTFQKTPKSENAQKCPKNEFLMCTRLSLRKPAYVHELLYIIVAYTLNTWIFALQPVYTSSCTWLLFLQPAYASWKCQTNTNFEIRVVWVVMQLTPSVVTTLSSTLTLL